MNRRYEQNSTWRMELNKAIEVVIRLPLLFIIDSALSAQMLKLFPWTYEPVLNFVEELDVEGASVLSGRYLILTVFLLMLIIIASAVVFCLTVQQIINVYTFLCVFCFLGLSYLSNELFITEPSPRPQSAGPSLLTQWKGSFWYISHNIVVQFSSTFLYIVYRQYHPSSTSHLTNFPLWQFSLHVIQQQATLWKIFGLSSRYLKFIPATSGLIMAIDFLVYFLPQINRIVAELLRCYYSSKYMLNNFGIQTFIENHWTRLYVPLCFRVFWILRTTIYALHFFIWKYPGLEKNLTVLDMVLEQLVCGCDTMVALIGMTSIISYIAHFFGVALAGFLRSDNEEDRNMGTMSAILFFILALQTGLTGLDHTPRLSRLLKNFCLLCTAILHYVHSMVNPQLLNLSASHRLSFSLHWRPLTLCAFLLIVPPLLLLYLWSRYLISTWLIAVTAFSVEVVLKVIISLMVYSLFMIDAYRDRFWEQLDDYVYYIQSVGNTIEFIFGILLFCNGGWIMLFESGGTIRAVMMCIHAYFNIWVQARDGWTAFMLRRTAVQKITSLPEANEKELEEFNDVCAICYQELATAKVTACQHYFHGVCLRKWLYVRDECPMCHQSIHA